MRWMVCRRVTAFPRGVGLEGTSDLDFEGGEAELFKASSICSAERMRIALFRLAAEGVGV
jgi:hypothetical protein